MILFSGYKIYFVCFWSLDQLSLHINKKDAEPTIPKRILIGSWYLLGGKKNHIPQIL